MKDVEETSRSSAPVSGTRARRAARTRDQILRAGLKVFSEKGFHSTTMDDIALELDATKGLLYYYFRTKEDILRAIISANPILEGIENMLGTLRSLNARDAMEAAFHGVTTLLNANRELVRFLHVQSALGGSEAQQVYGEMQGRILAAATELIKERQRMGDTRADLNPQHVAKLISDFLTWDFISSPEKADEPAHRAYFSTVIEIMMSGGATPKALAGQRSEGKPEGRKSERPRRAEA